MKWPLRTDIAERSIWKRDGNAMASGWCLREQEFNWKVASKGNSGIKYRRFYLTDGDAAGYEYQLADDAGDPGAIRSPRERSGALYGVLPPMKSVVKPAGEFNHSVVVVRGGTASIG